uniref:DUF6688 domain-containing protein n=1 Tax=Niastella caeni TaxID=2569763 RepID=UPI00140DFDCA|nr:DUF6688 family protein [Niastella caeni]
MFSPEHRASIYTLIFLCLVAYFYSGYRKAIATPVVEIITNSLLITGIVLNILMFIHEEIIVTIIGNTPIIFLFILMLVKNQRLLIEHIQQMEIEPRNSLEGFALKILLLKPFAKFSVLFVLCLPLLAIITGILLLFGQKPDSMIRAFTDTYKHGFSQLDYMCANVDCGEHFLCSVAAKGHKDFVKPTRLGIRKERLILCNRQLLVSNAFEDLLQHKLPFLHKTIRRNYNRVGNLIHRHYTIFNNKWVCDVVYVIMKPAEWFFLLVLYTFDRNPENRIAKQYISSNHRQQLESQ